MRKRRRHRRKWARQQQRIRMFSEELTRFRQQLGKVQRERNRKLNYLVERMNRLWPGEFGS
ncbi:hypothetical protein [Chitinophaga caseinilytica]|uniref:Uncharacterized protein n=1 Tax=Chitinophaga caseinilytica TaxID=2267521 RepID=A0ABZ2Z9S4_9BACT